MANGGDIAIVTGGGGGLGGATAGRLAADGWRVALFDRKPDALATVRDSLPGTGHRAFDFDIRDAAAVDAAFDAVEGEMGPTRLLACFAGGIFNRSGLAPTIENLTPEDWSTTLDINATGSFLCLKALFRHRRARPVDHGRAVLTSSTMGQMGGAHAGAGYAAAKAAIIGLMKTAAAEGAALGLTVNAISPGAIGTGLFNDFNTPETIERMKRMAPVRRIGEPSEIAGLVAYLASPETGFITGATLDINGGIRMS